MTKSYDENLPAKWGGFSDNEMQALYEILFYTPVEVSRKWTDLGVKLVKEINEELRTRLED